MDIPLKWVAALDADVNTTYRIDSDAGTSGTFVTVDTVDATDRGDGSFTPFATTLNGAISDSTTTLILTDATQFVEGDYIQIGKETILLGTKSVNTFSDCERGTGSSIPQSHLNLVSVQKLHESYTDIGVTFGARYLIRYHIVRLQDGIASPALEILAINPPVPPTSDYCVIYGIENNLSNIPQASRSVSVAMASDSYFLDTGERIEIAGSNTSSDADGFWFFSVPKSASRVGGDPLTLLINGNELTWSVANVPDLDSVNFLLL